MIGNHFPKFLAVLAAKTIVVGTLLSSTGVAQANLSRAPIRMSQATYEDPDVSVTFNPPGGGAPHETRGGASRGDVACTENTSSVARQFMPLTPTSSYGLTSSGHPVLFAYVPPTSAPAAFFSLSDEHGEVYYQTTISIPKDGGLVQVAIPDTLPPLEVGKPYQWGMAILCSGRLRPDSPFISSWIERTELGPDVTNQLSKASPLEQAALYGTQGIWYDTIATLVSLRESQPNDPAILANWERLLQSVGLDAVASAPVSTQP